MNRALLNAALASFVWVFAAVVVALPVELLHGRFTEASTKMLAELHVIFLCVLIFLDVWIGAKLLQERRIEHILRQNAFKIVGVLAVPAIIFGVAWRAYPEQFWRHIYIPGIFSFIVLWLLRYWTYHGEVIVSPINGPTIES